MNKLQKLMVTIIFSIIGLSYPLFAYSTLCSKLFYNLFFYADGFVIFIWPGGIFAMAENTTAYIMAFCSTWFYYLLIGIWVAKLVKDNTPLLKIYKIAIIVFWGAFFPFSISLSIDWLMRFVFGFVTVFSNYKIVFYCVKIPAVKNDTGNSILVKCWQNILARYLILTLASCIILCLIGSLIYFNKGIYKDVIAATIMSMFLALPFYLIKLVRDSRCVKK